MDAIADPQTFVNEVDSAHPHTTQRPAKWRPQTVFRNASTAAGHFTIIPNALLQYDRIRPAALPGPDVRPVTLEGLGETRQRSTRSGHRDWRHPAGSSASEQRSMREGQGFATEHLVRKAEAFRPGPHLLG
jgi:hypothetical protein